MSEESAPTLAATDDLKLAAVAAGCTVGLTLFLRFGLDRDVSLLVRLAPLLPYFAYIFTRRIDLGAVDTVRNWSAVTLAVTVATVVYCAA